MGATCLAPLGLGLSLAICAICLVQGGSRGSGLGLGPWVRPALRKAGRALFPEPPFWAQGLEEARALSPECGFRDNLRPALRKAGRAHGPSSGLSQEIGRPVGSP